MASSCCVIFVDLHIFVDLVAMACLTTVILCYSIFIDEVSTVECCSVAGEQICNFAAMLCCSRFQATKYPAAQLLKSKYKHTYYTHLNYNPGTETDTHYILIYTHALHKTRTSYITPYLRYSKSMIRS